MSQNVRKVVVGTEVKPVDLGNGMFAKLRVSRTKRGNRSVGFYLMTKKGSNSYSELWLNETQCKVTFKAFPEFYPVMEKMLARAKEIDSVGCEIKSVNPVNPDGTDALRPGTKYKVWVNIITKDGWRPVVGAVAEYPPKADPKPEPKPEPKVEVVVPSPSSEPSVEYNPFDELAGYDFV